MVAQWAEIGIQVEIKTVDFATLMSTAGSADYDLLAVQYTYPPADYSLDLVYLLAGEGSWTGGSIRYEDQELLTLSEKELDQIRGKEISMIFQDPYSSLNPRKHIYEILSAPMLYHGISSKQTVEKDVKELLEMVGMPQSALGRYPHEFSGGQRQRIGIARALSLNPEFIICDEPVSALDVSVQAQILNLLKDLQKELHLTLLFIGHGLGRCIM